MSDALMIEIGPKLEKAMKPVTTYGRYGTDRTFSPAADALPNLAQLAEAERKLAEVYVEAHNAGLYPTELAEYSRAAQALLNPGPRKFTPGEKLIALFMVLCFVATMVVVV